jgi:16S rRNA (cytosine967-C5)-methyltransferase
MELLPERLDLLRKNCQIWHIFPQRLIRGDANKMPFKPVFDTVMLDVPCSGFGTIRKNPDIKWRRRLGDIMEFQSMQSTILRNSAGFVKPGGMIVYSTCTIDPSENEQVIEQFLNDSPGQFEVIEPDHPLVDTFSSGGYVRTFPHKHDMDGAFAAYIKRCY